MNKNITMVVDDKILKRARKAAMERNTSLNDLIRKYLEQLAAREDEKKSHCIDRLEKLFNNSKAVVGTKKWYRDELYER
jgi:hypothetical protein